MGRLVRLKNVTFCCTPSSKTLKSSARKSVMYFEDASVTVGPRGTNLDFSATDIKVVPWKPASGSGANDAAFTCEGKFVPMH